MTSIERPRCRVAAALSVIMLVAGLGLPSATARAGLGGTTIDVTLTQTHPSFGYVLDFTHDWGTTLVVSDPLYPQFPITIQSTGSVPGFDHALVVDYSANQYGDFAGQVSSIDLTNIADAVDAASVALLDENGGAIGSVSGSGATLSGSWFVSSVLAAGASHTVTVAWDDAPTGPPVPQPASGEPLAALPVDLLLRFNNGRDAFNEVLTIENGLGPVFNQISCGACHNKPVGGPGTQTVTRFGLIDKGVFMPLDHVGGTLLQSQANDPGCAEDVPVEANVTSFRVTNGALGYGLIEAIPDASILALESSPPGVSGRAHIVEALEAPGVPRVGRFGWKAQVATVLTFAADASLNEMGLTNRFLTVENDPNGALPPDLGSCDTVPDPEDGPDANGLDFIDRVTDFQRFLAAPPQTPKTGMTGEAIFVSVGCAECHTPSFVTTNDVAVEPILRNRTIRPYTDFLLHDMGLAADFIADGDAGPREVRTPPLWGLNGRDPIWHDGRFAGGSFGDRVTAAIEEHGAFGSEGVPTATNFAALNAGDRAALLAFLSSLGRREFDADGDDEIDLDDFAAFIACLGGTSGPDDPCAIADFDADGDVDPDDFAAFLLVYAGPLDDCNANGTSDLADIVNGTSVDANGDGRPDECSACASDLDNDGTTGFTDLNTLLGAWGTCPAAPAPCPGDLDGNGAVGFADLNVLLTGWGPCT